MKSQSGTYSNTSSVVIFIGLILIMALIVYLTIHVEQPYIKIIDYIYKSNYYQTFILPDGYDIETQGREWCNWHQDETGIQTICNLFNKSAGYTQDNPKRKAAKDCIKLWEEWIVAFLSELEKTEVVNPSFQGFPWGANWYQFTISAPTNLAYYIVNKNSSAAVKRAAAKAIQYLIIDPQHSLGYQRDKANSAMMLFPWTLSHMITGTLDVTNEGYLYGIDQYNLAPNTTIRLNEDGVHLDYAYMTHSGVYAFGYFESIYDIYPDTKQIIDEVNNFDLDYHYDMWTSKLYHPTIPRSGSTLFHRREEVVCNTYKGSTVTPSVVVVPSMKYLRIFGDDFQWSVRLGNISSCYYECDQTVYTMGLYSCLCKERYTMNDSDTATYKTTGFIYPKGQTFLTPVDPNPDNKPNPTTYGYYMSTNTNKAHSAVFVDYDNGIAFFKVLHCKYLPLIPPHIDESGYYDMETGILQYWILLSDRVNYTFVWGRQEYDLSNMDLGGKSVAECTMNMFTGETTIGESSINDKYTAEIKDIDNRYTSTCDYDNNYPSNGSDPANSFSILNKKDSSGNYVPFLYIPGENEIHDYDKTVTYNGVTTTYKFDHEWNQYINVNYVKQNTWLNKTSKKLIKK
ncbi:ODV-E66 [Aratus pisonii nudivirus]|nr:ODV-E66 [Aratus pisonii nudivirus]